MSEFTINEEDRLKGKRYMISDAAKLVDVESHVLRYWEEELDIEIPRNEMGHRYYTDFYIQAFKKVKDLKDQGFLLKAIKIALPEIMEGSLTLKDEGVENQSLLQVDERKEEISKVEQFQMIVGSAVSMALKENNQTLTNELSRNVSESVIKEMDYLLRLKEEREEERFKKFDEMMRQMQVAGKMGAKKKGERKRFFGKK